jgi:hypothetical protein
MSGPAILAMSDGGYVGAAWGGTVVLIAGYALVVISRGRKLSRRVPPEERRWS